jgi:hypothetical protein
VEILKEHFFPITLADLLDIECQVNSPPFEIEQTAWAVDISTILGSCPPLSASREDEVPLYFLRSLEEPVI